MKKLIALFLALAMLLALCGCGGDGTEATEEETVDILGKWVSVKDNTYSLTFLDDGTCFYNGTPPTDPRVTGVVLTLEEESGENGTSYIAYNFDADQGKVTVLSTFASQFDLVMEEGHAVLANADGEAVFVRTESYSIYHAEYLAAIQAAFDDFYAEGKEGRTELVTGTAYTIQDGLDMTVTGCVLMDRMNVNDFAGTDTRAMYLEILVENTSEEGIYIRQDGIYIDGNYWYKWGSDVPASVETKFYQQTTITVMFTNEETDASDYIFKYEELDDEAWMVGSGNHIYLEPGQQGTYYFQIGSISVDLVKSMPAYAILTFEKGEFFCDLSEVVKLAN